MVGRWGWRVGRFSHTQKKRYTKPPKKHTQHRAQVGGVTYTRLRDRATEHPSLYTPRYNDPFY